MELIDKAALKTYIGDLCQCCGCAQNDECCNCYIEDIYFYLNTTKTIEAEPVRHGRWIKMTGMMPPEYHGHYECSECQWHMKGIRSSWTREEELTYCPNCGVRMDGGDDDA